MTKERTIIAVLGALLVAGFFYHSHLLVDAGGDTTRLELRFNETDAKLHELDQRVKELEAAHELDEQRINELEGR